MSKIQLRIDLLRKQMELANVQAYYISGADPHQSEYVPGHWQSRAFISGFTGSAGMVIVTLNEAALWTDSRYFLQAEKELAGTGIQLMKQRIEGTPSPTEWLVAQLKPGEKLGVDVACISSSEFKNLQQELIPFQINISPNGDLLSGIWDDRPELPTNLVFEHEPKFAGTIRQQKWKQIRQEIIVKDADYLLITTLDELAWAFNLRGSDVDYNPVFLAYALIGLDEVFLFVGEQKLNAKLKAKLQGEGVSLKPYEQFDGFLKKLDRPVQLLIDPVKTNQYLLDCLSSPVKKTFCNSVISTLKAQKSKEEIENIRNAMQKDGVAMVNFLFWLNQTVGKSTITELDVAQKVTSCRSEQDFFMGESFHPIVGFQEHGAVVHYRVTAETAKSIVPTGFLLIDSGGQYLDGTTDITRTIALSGPTEREKKDFTLVLKGMIALSMAIFPEGTKGCNLDMLARKALWEHGLNYGHGTGHGVGYFLNVHEGPMSIRQEFNEHAIQAGMVVSNEPGLYREREYGIRIENMIVCVEKGDQGFGRFLGFETLTLCPIDQKAIETSLLDQNEINWLNNYHQRVFDELSPSLDDDRKNFLKELTKPLPTD